MTMTPFTCERFADHLADYLEHDALPAVTAAMDAHAMACAGCRALRTDLEAIRSGAAMLPELAPSRDLWAGIAGRIEAPVVPLNVTREARRTAVTAGAAASAPADARRQDGRSRRWWAHPALAAAALVGITAGVTYTATREAMQSSAPAATTTAAATAPTGGIEDAPASPIVDGATPGDNAREQRVAVAPSGGSDVAAVRGPSAPAPRRGTPVATMAAYRPGELGALDSLYFREIVRLRQVLNARRDQLDSTTVEVLDRNMLVIDRAIAECRKALAADPASRFLNGQLNDALESKIELLRTAATMAVGE